MQGKTRRAGTGGEGAPGPLKGYSFARASAAGCRRKSGRTRDLRKGAEAPRHGKNGEGAETPCFVYNTILTANGPDDNKQYGVFACDIGTHLQNYMDETKILLQIPLGRAIMRDDERAIGLLA